MKQRIRNSIALLIVPCFLLLGATDANAGMSKGLKIGIGIALVVGGIGVGAHAFNNATFCGGFLGSSCYDSGGFDKESAAALVMVGAGTTLIIIAATEKKKPEKEAGKFREGLVPKSTVEISFGAAPIKKGWAAAARIRW